MNYRKLSACETAGAYPIARTYTVAEVLTIASIYLLMRAVSPLRC